MKIGKLILAGLAGMVFYALFGWLTCGWLFGWIYELPPTIVWRDLQSMGGGFWGVLNIGNLVLTMIFAIFYSIFGCVFKGGKTRKGFLYGLSLWFIATLPGMFYTYMFMNVAGMVVIYWTIQALIQYPVVGMIVAWIYPLNDCECCK